MQGTDIQLPVVPDKQHPSHLLSEIETLRKRRNFSLKKTIPSQIISVFIIPRLLKIETATF